MRILLVIFSLFILSGCDFLTVGVKQVNSKAQCEMNGFRGFPSIVTGSIVFEMRSTTTIAIFNYGSTERVDMTFPKGLCRRVK